MASSPRRLRALLAAPLHYLSTLRHLVDSTCSPQRSELREGRLWTSAVFSGQPDGCQSIDRGGREVYRERLVHADAALRQSEVQLECERSRQLSLEGRLLRLRDSLPTHTLGELQAVNGHAGNMT